MRLIDDPGILACPVRQPAFEFGRQRLLCFVVQLHTKLQQRLQLCGLRVLRIRAYTGTHAFESSIERIGNRAGCKLFMRVRQCILWWAGYSDCPTA